jgi:CO/xanthine dehydrogenase Mo-binding subunit
VDTRSQPFRIIGRKTPKVDAIDKVTGRAQFGADIPLPRLLVGKVLRSPYAYARIRRIDTRNAAALPGVRAVITGDDLPPVIPGAQIGSGTVTIHDRYLSQEVLARDRVLFHGHAVAAVAATSIDVAVCPGCR